MAQTATTVYSAEVNLREWCYTMSPGNGSVEEKIADAQKIFEWVTINSNISVVDGSGTPVK
jgi:hypothetical protein